MTEKCVMTERCVPPGEPAPNSLSSAPGRDRVAQPALAKHDGKLLDLAFAMDTTGSMGSYINAARDNVRKIAEEIVAKESCDVRLALVNYRDHPPQDMTYVTDVHDFTPRVAEMKRWLENTSAAGGGDTPEAVADALHQVLKLSWRPEATKICVLISDAPPHGLYPPGDGFPNGCPEGLDPMTIVREMAEKAITLYVAGCEPSLTPYKDFFAAMAYVTGGQYVPLKAATALTSVIVGGAQEELSLEQWMEQVNQMVMAEVRERGEADFDMDAVSSRVRDELNRAGARARQLKVDSTHLAPPTSYVTSLSTCRCMEDVRKEWKAAEVTPERGARCFFAPSRSAMSEPRSTRTRSRGLEESHMPLARCAPAAAALEAPVTLVEDETERTEACGKSSTYETDDAEINIAQAQRMLQKALMRNKVSVPRK